MENRSRTASSSQGDASERDAPVHLIEVVASELNIIRQRNGKRWLSKVASAQLLREDLELDSLDLAELTVRLQAKFGVDVFAKRNLRTVGDVIEELGGA